jgi:predicted secreted acid phosphatase
MRSARDCTQQLRIALLSAGWIESQHILQENEDGAVQSRRGSWRVTIFYVTNRAANLKEATRANLEKDGFPFERRIDTLYYAGQQPDWGTDKTTRRAEIAGRFRILLLFGDDLGDFLAGAANPVARRRELAAPYQDW